MRRLISVAILLVAVPLAAQQVRTFQSLTVADASVGLAAATLDSGNGTIAQCVARLETAQVRYRFDGTAPTSSEGMLLEVGDVLEVQSLETAKGLRFIRTGGTSGVLKVSCWR